jgi:hypothetical protein
MSLNRYEQILSDYIEGRPEEKRFWMARVLELARRPGRREEAVLELNAQLWEYFEERARHESPFREIAVGDGLRRVSLLNLAEYWLRMWPPPQKGGKKR